MTSHRSTHRGLRGFLAGSRVGAAVVLALLWLLAGPAARAAGPVGPVGPIGPVGLDGTAASAPSDASRPAAPSVPRPASPAAKSTGNAARTGNRIEVSGNTASGTRCAQDGPASVNSVDVSGARLEGRTVIVQGRNANNVRTVDCPDREGRPAPPSGAAGQQAPGSTSVNSIRIR